MSAKIVCGWIFITTKLITMLIHDVIFGVDTESEFCQSLIIIKSLINIKL